MPAKRGDRGIAAGCFDRCVTPRVVAAEDAVQQADAHEPDTEDQSAVTVSSGKQGHALLPTPSHRCRTPADCRATFSTMSFADPLASSARPSFRRRPREPIHRQFPREGPGSTPSAGNLAASPDLGVSEVYRQAT